jgi:hypothetical protein
LTLDWPDACSPIARRAQVRTTARQVTILRIVLMLHE